MFKKKTKRRRKLAASRTNVSKKKSKKRILKIAIFLSIILLIIFIFLRVKFFLGEPLHFRLSPNEINFYLSNNQTISQDFSINVDNFPTCSSDCRFTLFDINTGKFIFTENSTIPFRKTLTKNISFHTPELGEGILLYRYDIVCSNKASLFCPTTGEKHFQSSFIKIDYELSPQDKNLKKTIKPMLSNLTALTNKNYKLFNHLLDLESRYNFISKIKKPNILFSINNSFSDIHDLEPSVQNSINNVTDLVLLWNFDRYLEINSTLYSIYNNSLSLNQNLTTLHDNILSKLILINTGNKILADYNSSKPFLNFAYNYYYQISNIFDTDSSIFKFYTQHILSENIKSIEDNLLFSSELTLLDFKSHTSELDNLSKSITQSFKKDFPALINPLHREASLLDTNLNNLFNSSFSNPSYFNNPNITTFISNESLELKDLQKINSLCTDITTLITKINSSKKDYLISLNTSNTTKNTNLSTTNISNSSQLNLTAVLNSNINSLIHEFNFTILSSNNSQISFSALYKNLRLYENLICNLSFPSTQNPFFTEQDFSEYNFSIPLFRQEYSNLSYQISNHSKTCCVIGDCSPCNSQPNNKSLYPLIFVHGHLFNSALSPESALKAFSLIANELEQFGYINTGDFDLPFFYENNLVGEWSEFNKPILTRVSYYFINYFDVGISTLQTQKSERIENYALRLNEFITAILKKTGQEKVNLVAYSMGGLVSREYLNIFGESKVDKLITLATPHHGVFGRVASICKVTGSTKECEDMEVNSSFLKRLNQPFNNPESVEIHTIGSFGCDMETDSGMGTGDGIVLYNHSQLSYATNYKIKGNCTDLFKTELHSKILKPEIYPQIPILIDSILKD